MTFRLRYTVWLEMSHLTGCFPIIAEIQWWVFSLSLRKFTQAGGFFRLACASLRKLSEKNHHCNSLKYRNTISFPAQKESSWLFHLLLTLYLSSCYILYHYINPSKLNFSVDQSIASRGTRYTFTR
jgi:hypothetical protein